MHLQSNWGWVIKDLSWKMEKNKICCEVFSHRGRFYWTFICWTKWDLFRLSWKRKCWKGNLQMLGISICFSICWIQKVKMGSSNTWTWKIQIIFGRQNGQEILTGMCVVIQEMVPAESAGVLFSRNPTSGDPSQIIITSNFGLGEV